MFALVTYTLCCRFETYDAEAHPTLKFGKRARVAAITALNINLSTANLNMFLESVISWRRQREFEQKAIQLNEVNWSMIYLYLYYVFIKCLLEQAFAKAV